MAYSIDDRSLIPLSELIGQAEFPLSDYLPLDSVASVFENLYYTEASLSMDGANVVLAVRLVWEGALELKIPGCDFFALVLASAGDGWSTVDARIVIGPDFSIKLNELTFGLRFDESVLKDVATEGPAEISISGNLFLSPDRVTLENATGPSLNPAYLCDTGIIVEADDVRPVFGIFGAPEFLADQDDFRGVAFELLKVTIPDEYLDTDPGADLTISMENAAIGSTGFTGQCTVASADLMNPVTGRLFGFPFRFKSFELDIIQNSIIKAALVADIHLEAFDEGSNEKWIGIDVSFNSDGNFAAALSAVQPPEASGGSSLVTLDFPGVIEFAISAVRIVRRDDIFELYLSGELELLVDGATWPRIEFDEFGLDSEGNLLLPEGAGITFASPLVVEWYFVRLTVAKFRFARGESSDTSLVIALSAEVNLLEGLPAGASVEGLTIAWDPATSADPSVSFSGIGIEFAIPGAFRAGIEVAFKNEAGVIEFRGQGGLELYALDMGIEVGIVVGYNQPEEFAFLYLVADARLLPSGIPIGQTGISIYGFQGLIAANMALDINMGLPEDERYYELFTRDEIGITHMSKWVMHYGQYAFGVGIVVGTADTGFSLNIKGLLVIAFPDLTLLLQCRANFLKIKPDLSTESEGTLDALMVYASGQATISIDILAYWGMPYLFEVTGSARAFFSFNDIHAWYLMIGQDQDGKRVSAHVLKWGNSWLFSAGFWFRLDEHGVVTGVLIEVGQRYEKGGFWIEARGSARGEMGIYWNPPQWEGSLALEGRIGAGYRGISVGIALGGDLDATVFKPTEVSLKVRACFSALFWDICKSHTFKWEKQEPPELESPLANWAATPRHWTPELLGTSTPGGNSKASLDAGVVTIDGSTPTIKPHSQISLDFERSMKDETGRFNETINLSDGGFQTIGRKSKYSACYKLNDVKLIRDPGGDNEEIQLWGTWDTSTPQYNTVLRLFSSERFGDDGSLSSSYSETIDIDYCDEPEDTVICVPLAGIEPGYGRLPDGSLYHWGIGDPDDDKRDNDGGVTLGDGDTLTIIPPGPAEDPEVVTTPGDSGPHGDDDLPVAQWWRRVCKIPPCRLIFTAAVLILAALLLFWRPLHRYLPPRWLLPLLLLLALILLLIVLLCHCRRRTDTKYPNRPDNEDQKPNEYPTKPSERKPCCGDNQNGGSGTSTDDGSGGHDDDGDHKPADRDENGSIVITPDGDGSKITKICYKPGHAPAYWITETRSGGTLTEYEEWTVPPEAKILQPNETYELRISHTPNRKAPNGTIDSPLGSPTVTKRFRTSGPPIYVDALVNYVKKVYPSNGNRPVYTGYDFEVVFHEDYVPYLYTSVGAQLRLRLLDGQGNLVKDAAGNVLLLSVSSEGEITRSQSQQWWEMQYRKNVNRNCIEGIPVFSSGTNTSDIDMSSADYSLTPNSQYTAQLISDSEPEVPLMSWSFTTAAFETFTDLITRDLILEAHHVTLDDAGLVGDFDTACRSSGIRTVNFVERTTIRAILNAAEDRVLGLLIESPEPIDATLRLTLTINGENTKLLANVDQTRLIAVHTSGNTWPIDTLTIKATWKRNIGSLGQTYAVSGVSADEIVMFEVSL